MLFVLVAFNPAALKVSLPLIADGALIYEQYFTAADQEWGMPLGVVAYDREKLHDLRSISKSVTSLLLGIALGVNFEQAHFQ